MPLYEPQFSDALDIDYDGPIRRTIVIASTPRSGSHMLGHAMTATGCMGVPLEYANANNLERWRQIFDVASIEEVFARLRQRRTTSNGVFAVKLHHGHLRAFGGLEQALALLPAPIVVRIARADVLRQAVSMAVAKQTGIWIAGQTGTGATPVYDESMIAECIDRIVVENAAWDRDLASVGVRPLMLEYTQVANDVDRCLEWIADAAGVAPPERIRRPATTKQSGARTDEWVTRYLASVGPARA